MSEEPRAGEPAMTKEQWRALREVGVVGLSETSVDASDRGDVYATDPVTGDAYIDHDDRDAVAAILLGLGHVGRSVQPPYFSWADVDLLEAAAHCCEMDDHYIAEAMRRSDYTKGREHALAAEYRALAARIAALLPPRA